MIHFTPFLCQKKNRLRMTAIVCFTIITACNKSPSDTIKPPDNNATLQVWLSGMRFQQVELTHARVGYKDIVFNQGNAAVMDQQNIVSVSYDNGLNWEEKLQLTGHNFNCIALKPDGTQLFIGGSSLGNYTFGATFRVYHIPRSGAGVLNYEGEAKLSNTDEVINHDFMRTCWNGDGSVYASFGRSNRRDGFFGNITPDGRKIFTRRTPSFSRINNRPPTTDPTHCEGFSIHDGNRTLILSAYEYSPTANLHFLSPYFSGDGNKGAGDTWLSLHNGWKPGLVKHMAENIKGDYMVLIGDADRFFINSKLFTERYVMIKPEGIASKMLCTAIDNDNYIWIGTDKGLFKSNKPLPPLYDPFG